MKCRTGLKAFSETKAPYVHDVIHPLSCSVVTVSLATRLYVDDLEMLGYTMDAARESCSK